MALNISRGLLRAVAHPLFMAWASTWKMEVVDGEVWQAYRSSETPRVILAWHEALLPLLWQHRSQDLAVLISDSRDGQYVGDLVRALGYRVIPGSSSKGATRALLKAVRALREGRSVGFSPDGPRGPRQTMKPGVILAAQRANAPIVPMHATSNRAWRLNSWDKFLIPKPFSRVRILYGQPFTVGPGEQGLADATAMASSAMAALVSEGHGTTTP